MCVPAGCSFCWSVSNRYIAPRTANHRLTSFGLTWFLPLLLGEAYGIYRIIKHDNELCRQLGYMCPFCQSPLYEARASTWISGLCPKCRKSVIA